LESLQSVRDQATDSLKQLKTYSKKYLVDGGEETLRSMRTRELEEEENRVDQLLQIKEIIAGKGISLNEYFRVR
jgi:hypothetical protein